MSDANTLTRTTIFAWPRTMSDPLVVIGAIVGLTPLLAGLLFTTYGYHVSPGWAELLRQLDVPFILVEVAVILWARQAGLNYRATYDNLDHPARIALLVFLGTFWLSSAFISTDPAYSILRASFWLVHIGFGFAVFHLVGTPTRANLLHCGVALLGGLLLFLPLMTVHLVSAPDPAMVRGGEIIWSSAIPGCLSVRHLGIWAALVLSCALGALYIRDMAPRERGILYVLIFVATAALFWSGTRAGLYGLAGALIVLIAVARARLPARVVVPAGVAVIAGALVSELWLPPHPAFGIFGRVFAQGDDLQTFSSGRTVIWASMMQAFAGSPLFGVGEGAVHWLAVTGDDHHVQPHNSVVQMLSGWGLIACLAAGYLLARLLLLVHRMVRRDTLVIPLVLMIDCLLIMSLADGALYFSRFIMWFAGGAAVVLAVALRGWAAEEVTPSPLPPGSSAHPR